MNVEMERLRIQMKGSIDKSITISYDYNLALIRLKKERSQQ